MRFTRTVHCSVATGLGVSFTATSPADDAADPGPTGGEGHGEAAEEDTVEGLINRAAAELHIDLSATEPTEADTAASLMADADAELAVANEHIKNTKVGLPDDTVPSADSAAAAALQTADGLLR